MTAATRSLRSVLSELLLVTVARSCGGGSSITDSSYRSRSSFFFFLRLTPGPRTLVFLVLTRGTYTCTFCLERVLVLSSSLPFLFALILVLIFHLGIVTRGWKNWTNHGKWKVASTKSVYIVVFLLRGVL